jgi:hypothetical protein
VKLAEEVGCLARMEEEESVNRSNNTEEEDDENESDGSNESPENRQNLGNDVALDSVLSCLRSKTSEELRAVEYNVEAYTVKSSLMCTVMTGD